MVDSDVMFRPEGETEGRFSVIDAGEADLDVSEIWSLAATSSALSISEVKERLAERVTNGCFRSSSAEGLLAGSNSMH